mmetsp:Transcript_21943/g.54310  ORF Transcript_21943/g.54310 Transcript_21943/m.54310 type:complete len:160 (-) Transcript_21943:681-1160(-)
MKSSLSKPRLPRLLFCLLPRHLVFHPPFHLPSLPPPRQPPVRTCLISKLPKRNKPAQSTSRANPINRKRDATANGRETMFTIGAPRAAEWPESVNAPGCNKPKQWTKLMFDRIDNGSDKETRKEGIKIEDYICGTAHSFFRVKPNCTLHVMQQRTTYYS